MGYTSTASDITPSARPLSPMRLRVDGDAETPPELRAQQLAAGEAWQSRENQAMGAAWSHGKVMEKCILYYKYYIYICVWFII